MAKKEVEEAKVQVQQEVEQGTEGTQEGKEQQVKETTAAPEAKVSKEGKKVKIHTTEEIDCIVAGVPYVIAKNKDAQVPADVAAILVNAKKAYRQ